MKEKKNKKIKKVQLENGEKVIKLNRIRFENIRSHVVVWIY